MSRQLLLEKHALLTHVKNHDNLAFTSLIYILTKQLPVIWGVDVCREVLCTAKILCTEKWGREPPRIMETHLQTKEINSLGENGCF